MGRHSNDAHSTGSKVELSISRTGAQPVRKNIFVIISLIAVLIMMVCAGVINYRKRQMIPIQDSSAAPNTSNDTAANPSRNDQAAQDQEMLLHPMLGREAPIFALKDPSGNVFLLSRYKGRPVILDFWATWCVPCRLEIPTLELFQKQYAGQGLQVLGISEDILDFDDKASVLHEEEEIAKKSASLHINYPVVIDNISVATKYGGIDGLPTTFFINRRGEIVASSVGIEPRDIMFANLKKALYSGAD